jgi:hypothetical protein
MKYKRFFAFGCSYTGYSWPTWADFVGVNFEEYYNFGRGGACNRYIMGTFLRVNDLHKFNKDDLVIVMFTSVNRNLVYKDKQVLLLGDITEDHPSYNKFSYLDGLLNTWMSSKVIKNTLVSLNIDHYLLQGLPLFWQMDPDNPQEMDILNRQYMVDDFMDNLSIDYSLDEWYCENYEVKTSGDSHPKPNVHYEYVKKFLPQFKTDKSKEFLDLTRNIECDEWNILQKRLSNFKLEYLLVDGHPVGVSL